MKQGTILKTFVSRFLILILNFGLVVYSTNMWGSKGKGEISIIIADLTIISFFANVFVGSSMSYFATKFRTEQILSFAYIWAMLTGVLIPLIFSFNHSIGYTCYLIGLSVMSSLLSANVNLFVGQQNIKMFNLYTVLQQVVHIVFILLMVYVVKFTSVSAYFIAQIGCFVLLFITSTVQITKYANFKRISFTKGIGSQLFSYGWKIQVSSFFQFLNNRLSFYFLEYFKGIMSVGVFSVGVAFSEAVWAVSRSLSIVLYADVVNNTDSGDAIEKTKISLRISFLITLFFILLMLLVPSEWYAFIFGKDFSQTKTIVLYLSPGILAIAVSNIIGYYFAGINKLRILNVKSFIGLIFTVGCSFYVIPRWGIIGACFVSSLSYCVSSAVLFWRFYQITEFRVRDFILSGAEINLLWKKLLRK